MSLLAFSGLCEKCWIFLLWILLWNFKRLSLQDVTQRKVAEKSQCVCISIPLAWVWVQRSQQWVSRPRGGAEVRGHFLVMLIGSILCTTRRRGRGQLLLWPCGGTADTSGQSLHPSLTNKHGKRWIWIPTESGSNRSLSSATIHCYLGGELSVCFYSDER